MIQLMSESKSNEDKGFFNLTPKEKHYFDVKKDEGKKNEKIFEEVIKSLKNTKK